MRMDIKRLVLFVFKKNLNDSEIDAIVWGCTGYPSFFPPGNKVKHLYMQLHHSKRAIERGFSIDDIYSGKDILSNNT